MGSSSCIIMYLYTKRAQVKGSTTCHTLNRDMMYGNVDTIAINFSHSVQLPKLIKLAIDIPQNDTVQVDKTAIGESHMDDPWQSLPQKGSMAHEPQYSATKLSISSSNFRSYLDYIVVLLGFSKPQVEPELLTRYCPSPPVWAAPGDIVKCEPSQKSHKWPGSPETCRARKENLAPKNSQIVFVWPFPSSNTY